VKLRLAIVVVMLFLLILILPFFVSQVESGTSTNTLYAHAETTTIGGVNYYLHKLSSADGPATTLSQSAVTTGRKLMGRWVYPLNAIVSIPASTWTITYRALKSPSSYAVVAHGDVDVVIRKSDNTIRTTLATDVANSPTITQTNTWQTLTGTYNWAAYTVVDQTDYLEVAYYIHVTTSQNSKSVKLLVDDSTLALADQTKVANVMFTYPNQAPVASFTYSPSNPLIYDNVTLDASASYDPDGSIVSYKWDFGDGNITTVTNPIITHIYTIATSTVNYTVTLTVTDNEGSTGFTTQIVSVTNPSILYVSLPAGTYIGPDPDNWLSQCWLLNITGLSGTFTVRINNTHASYVSYNTHLIIALNNGAYNYLSSLTVDSTTISPSSFTYGKPQPYGFTLTWENDVYPTWFSDIYVVGDINPKSYKDVTVAVTFSNTTGVRTHFDAYGSADPFSPPPTSKGHVTDNPHEKDSTVLFWPPLNTPPVLSPIGDKTVDEMTTLSFTATATDPDVPPQTLTFSLGPGAPSGASITSGGFFTWTPTEDQGPSSYIIRIIVSDGIAQDYEDITVTVNEVNLAPILDPIGAKAVNELSLLTFTATASDPDIPAQTLTFSLGPGAPAGASINAMTGVFTWTPTEAQGPGVYTIRVIVSDGNLTDYEDVSVTVNEVNVAPVLDPIGAKSVNELELLTFTATASDTDLPPQTLTFSLGVGAPAGASINSATGVFTWTPTEAHGPSVYTIRIIVSDGSLQDYEDITVTVNEVNVAPVLNPIGPKNVNEGTTLSFTATATDADIPAQTLTFSLGAGAPAGASITSGGAFSWTPTEAQGPGVYTIRIIVSDGLLEDYEDIVVTVNEVNLAPVLNPIGPKSVNEGTTLSFTATATDADLPAQTLTFSLGPGAPSGASITSGGAFTWTPTEAQGPGSYTIRIIVSDGIAQDYEDITVTVNEVKVNQPPVLNPIGPKTVSVGNLLQFTVTASDSDIPAQTLTYSANNLPTGATFDPNTHVFNWTPTSGQAGVYPSVHFEVTDGILTDSEDITITVTAPAKPVGGYSISLTKQTSISHVAAYTMLIALFGAVLILTKRKRK